MEWSDPGTHRQENCYVCANDMYGINRIKAKKWIYQGVASAMVPTPHDDEHPVPQHPTQIDFSTASVSYLPPSEPTDPADPDYVQPPAFCFPSLISQEHLDRIVRKLHLSQNNAMTLASELRSVHVLAPGVKVTEYRHRQEPFLPYYTLSEDGTYTFCHDIVGLMNAIGVKYKKEKWRIFIDSSKRSLKAVLLYENSTIKPVPIFYGVGTKETDDSMEMIINSVNYNEHMWRVNCDFKVLALLTGLNKAYCKYCCPFCKWDSRWKGGNHYDKKNWPLRTERGRVGYYSIVRKPIIERSKVMIPNLHIKLGIVKSFIKTLVATNITAFNHLKDNVFPKLTVGKITEGVLNGPDIRKLLKDERFVECLSRHQAIAWDSIKAVLNDVLGNNRTENYRVLLDDMMDSFKQLDVHMSLKIHVLHAHYEFLDMQKPTESDEPGEWFHQTIMEFENRFAGKRLDSMLADFCWWISHDQIRV
ncbi:uncharacterized protein LOC116349672 [Contarinia nasturtii]|uniref:uncharacterized protein LOC116349672 n=1 Tax=Contarinia nasturtii TaxID=265458 RepID=UPI0012D499EC|nr:uncharacterized protein LOC116349672 [Contarinia nasturtii]